MGQGMGPSVTPKMDEKTPLYNSSITKVYMEYVERRYPQIDIDPILDHAGITRHAVDDPAHWFTQRQVDRFQERLVASSGNREIAREAGRYAASSERLSTGKQYALGLISLTSVYILMEKLYPMMSRGAAVKARKLAPNKVEIISTPKEGVHEKPYQCENRLGTFESISKWFTQDYARIEHPSCIHRGDECCRYIVSWENPPFLMWKRARNYSGLMGFLVSVPSFFFLPAGSWVFIPLLSMLLTMGLAVYSYHLEKKALIKTIETQGNAAKGLLEEVNIRYNNSLLVQEIGHAASTVLHIDSLFSTVVKVMENRLDFDRGLIMLANEERTALTYRAGYGYEREKEEILKETPFHLDNPHSRGLFVLSFKDRKPFLINDISQVENQFSKKSRELARLMGVHSLVCVPIAYKDEPLGVLAVDNVESKRPFTESDLNLLKGVASQLAVSIVNAMSFEKLKQSERKYRELVENANSIIMRLEPGGHITFFNEFAQGFFGYSEDEITGRNILGTIVPDMEETRHDLEDMVRSLRENPGQQGVSEKENLLRNGERVRIAWTYKPVFDEIGRLKEILCIGSDITELARAAEEKRMLETQLLQAQKMEAVGTMAGGIAHDFNNILQVIYGYAQILLMENGLHQKFLEKLQGIEKAAKRAGELTRSLLIFSRKVESELKPVNLNEEVVQVSKMLERVIPKMIRIELNLATDLHSINADAGQTEQIIMNLGVNARDAMPDGGTLVFGTENIYLDEAYCMKNSDPDIKPGKYVMLYVSDSGCGMDKDVKDRIFEPFYTTKERGQGTGLGLAMVYGIIKNHSGHISCDSWPGHGTTFKIYFPVVEEQVRAGHEKEKAPVAGGGETILLVDDEDHIRQIGREMLTKFGYTVLTAQDGETALEVYRMNSGRIGLILLDLIMPGMGGVKCLEEIIRINPRARVVVVTGYSASEEEEAVIRSWARGFVSKPYETSEILRVVRDVLGEGPLIRDG